MRLSPRYFYISTTHVSFCYSKIEPTGVYSLNAGNNNKYKGVYYKVKRIVQHPSYDALTIDYDIALLEVRANSLFYSISLTLSLYFSTR